MADASRYVVHSVVKALNILEAFAQNDGREVNLVELSQIIGEHKSVTHRLVTTLHDRRFLDRDPVTKRYSIGPRMFILGSLYKRHKELERVIVPMLREMTRTYGHTAYLGVLDGNECLFTATVEGWHPVRIAAKPGERRPLHATAAGKCMLASMPEAEARRLLAGVELVKLTSTTITDLDELMKELEQVRATGFALCREEMWEGITALGAPLTDSRGRLIGAISLSFPTFVVSDAQIEELAAALRNISSRASRLLEGGKEPPGTDR